MVALPQTMSRRRSLVGSVLLAVAAATTWAQALTVSTSGGALRVRAPDLRVIAGPVLERLKEGRTVRLGFELGVMSRPRGTVLASQRQGFTLSLDLWEERMAVTRLGPEPLSVSRLRPADAEAWCLDHLTVPLVDLGALGRQAPFWIRLSYVVESDEPPGRDGGGLTLKGLIDRLSRRRQDGIAGRTIEAGPFRLSN